MNRNPRNLKIVLVFGYCAFILGVWAAIRAPAKTYELHMYAATPDLFWVGLLAALAASVFVTFATGRKQLVGFSLFLGGIGVIAVYGLPLLRGYYFYGAADSMTHIGLARSLLSNRLQSWEVIYPGVHLLSVILHTTLGFELRKAMLVVTLLFPVVFVAVIPLLVYTLDYDLQKFKIFIYSAMFLLPINLIGLYPSPFPSSQALLYVPVVLYLFLRERQVGQVSLKVALVLTYIGVLFLHPQQALSLVCFIFGFIIFDRLLFAAPGRGVTRSVFHPLYLFLLISLVLWVVFKGEFTWAVSSLTQEIVSPNNGTYITNKTSAIAAVGGSIVMLVLKLFGVGVIYSVLTVAFIFVIYMKNDRSIQSIFRDVTYSDRVYLLLILNILVLLPLIGIYIVSGDLTNQMFRYHGFIMLIITIAGALALRFFLSKMSERLPFNWSTVSTVVVFLFLILSVITIHGSPYVYQPSDHVTESRVTGYELAFEYRDEGIYFTSTHTPVYRYVDFLFGFSEDESKYVAEDGSSSVKNHYYNQRLPAAIGRRYVTVTCYEKEMYTNLYNGEYFSRSDFRYLNQAPDIDKPISNGCFEMYLVG